MFNWYEDAQVCYAYLSDVPYISDVPFAIASGLENSFRLSQWFTRGWTLQELLAPHEVDFYDKNWNWIGSKQSLHKLISEITGIHDLFDFRSACVAQKMSWAATRQTTRIEDQAYCLLGLFGVYMPPLYGEGQNAFFRLQLEIISKTDDDSILAWSDKPTSYGPRSGQKKIRAYGLVAPINNVLEKPRTLLDNHAMSAELFLSTVSDHNDAFSLLASSPKCFASCSSIVRYLWDHSRPPHTMTSKGLSIHVPLVRSLISKTPNVLEREAIAFAPLNCAWKSSYGGINKQVVALAMVEHSTNQTWSRRGALVTIDPEDHNRSTMVWSLLCVPHAAFHPHHEVYHDKSRLEFKIDSLCNMGFAIKDHSVGKEFDATWLITRGTPSAPVLLLNNDECLAVLILEHQSYQTIGMVVGKFDKRFWIDLVLPEASESTEQILESVFAREVGRTRPDKVSLAFSQGSTLR